MLKFKEHVSCTVGNTTYYIRRELWDRGVNPGEMLLSSTAAIEDNGRGGHTVLKNRASLKCIFDSALLGGQNV